MASVTWLTALRNSLWLATCSAKKAEWGRLKAERTVAFGFIGQQTTGGSAGPPEGKEAGQPFVSPPAQASVFVRLCVRGGESPFGRHDNE